jgi:two-component system nitrate/nitrite response regulator NarL
MASSKRHSRGCQRAAYCAVGVAVATVMLGCALTPAGSGEPLRIVICDDHAVFADSLAAVLKSFGHEVVHVSGSAEQAVARALMDDVDLVVMDVTLDGDDDGLSATRELTLSPTAPPVFVLTARTDPAVLSAAVESGASGVATKQLPLETVVTALSRVGAGETYYEPHLMRNALLKKSPQALAAESAWRHLTDREREVLERIVRGESTDRMAFAMKISVPTLRSHVHAVLTKLNVHSRLQAAAWAVAHGLADTPRSTGRDHER